MSKVKVRCTICGKWFQSANAKDTICPECAQKAKKEKQAAKVAPSAEAKPASNKTAPPPPPKQKQAKGGTNQWLDAISDVKIAQPEQPTRPKIPPSPPRDTRSGPIGSGSPVNYRDDRDPSFNRDNAGGASGIGAYQDREGNNRGPGNYRETRPAPYRVGGGYGLPNEPRPRQPMEGRGPRVGGEFRPGADRGERGNRPDYKGGKPGGKPKVKTPKPPPEPKPKREKIPPPLPFVPTPEQITQVQTRYLELAQPEFDGIRTQIAQELSIPKKAVKQIVKELRDSQHIPSWWDSQTFKGSEEDMARIREVYEPTLPLPDVGVHKKIAEQLSLKPVDVYHAIKTIRAQMNLPQYNDPALHGIELKPRIPKGKQQETGETAEFGEVTAEATQEIPESPKTPETSSEPIVSTDDISTTDTAAVAAAKTDAPAVTAQTEEVHSSDVPDVLDVPDTVQATPVPTDDISTTDTAAVANATNGQEQVTSGERSESAIPDKPVEVEQSISTEV